MRPLKMAACLAALGLFPAGCAVATVDPLLCDDSGGIRMSVGLDEVQQAGVATPCESLDESRGEVVRIPIEGTRLVLVGVSGIAMCVEEEGGELPRYEAEEQVELPEDSAVRLADDAGSAIGGRVASDALPRVDDPVEADPYFGGPGSKEGLPYDPTPEPIRD